MKKRNADFSAAETLYNEKIFSRDQSDEKQIHAKLAETQYRITQHRLESKSIKAPLSLTLAFALVPSPRVRCGPASPAG